MVSTALAQAVQAAPATDDGPKGPIALLQSPAMLQQVTESLPAGIDAQAFVRHGITLVKANPDLLSCDPVTVAQGIVRGAALGLDPDPALGQMWLVPRNVKKRLPGGGEQWVKEATFQIGYKGLRELAIRTGRFAKIEVHEVRQGDHFRATFGRDGCLEHEPDWFGDRGPVVGWYAYALQHDGTEQFEVLSVAQAQEHREKYADRDRNGEVKGFWKKDFTAAAERTVFLRLAKWLPKSVEQQQALAVDGTVTRTPLGSVIRDVDVIRVDGEQAAIEATTSEPEPEPAADEADIVPAEDAVEGIEVVAEVVPEPVPADEWATLNRKAQALASEAWEQADRQSRRKALIQVVSNGRTDSSKGLSAEEWSRMLAELEDIKLGVAHLHQRSNGEWELRKVTGGAS